MGNPKLRSDVGVSTFEMRIDIGKPETKIKRRQNRQQKGENEMKEKKYYRCEVCGNLVEMIEESGIPMICCNQEMTLLTPGSVDASAEKHVPDAFMGDGLVKVNVGKDDHPMTKQHYIQWITLVTEQGSQTKCLCPDDKPTVTFYLNGEKPLAVYAYCNIHGLWMTKL